MNFINLENELLKKSHLSLNEIIDFNFNKNKFAFFSNTNPILFEKKVFPQEIMNPSLELLGMLSFYNNYQQAPATFFSIFKYKNINLKIENQKINTYVLKFNIDLFTMIVLNQYKINYSK